MTEAKFQTAFNKWAKHNIDFSGAFELKLVKGNSMPFSAVMEHQVQNLLIVKHSILTYKIPDAGIAQKPFDCFTLKGNAFIVINYYIRGQKEFVIIDIDDFVKEKETSERKSLTEERAKQIGNVYYLA